MGTPDNAMDTIDDYLAEAEGALRRRLPDDLAEQRLAEAREHLVERAAELSAGGMAPEQAQATAVSAFGPAREWAVAIAEAAYADTGAMTARRIAIAAAALIVFVPLVEMLYLFFAPPPNPWPYAMASAEIDFVALAACVLAVSSLRGRRAQPFAIASIALLAAAVAFFACGSGWVVAPGNGRQWRPGEVDGLIGGLAKEIPDNRNDLALVSLGMQAFCRPDGMVLEADMPADLRAGSGYITPIPAYPGADTADRGPTMADTEAMDSPFKGYDRRYWQPYLSSSANVDVGLKMKRLEPYHTAPTIEEAEAEWRERGPTWMMRERALLAARIGMLGQMQRLASQPAEFVWQRGAVGASMLAVYVLGALVLDLLAAHAGRLLLLRSRGRSIRT